MLKGALVFALGILVGWGPQAFDRALERDGLKRERAQAVALVLDNAELRHSSRQLRQQCPAKVRVLQPLLYRPGAKI